MNPGIKRFRVAPTRYDEHLVLCVGLQDLHGDETGETLYVAAALGEPLDDLIGRALLYR
jgi:hypothetical protein